MQEAERTSARLSPLRVHWCNGVSVLVLRSLPSALRLTSSPAAVEEESGCKTDWHSDSSLGVVGQRVLEEVVNER